MDYPRPAFVPVIDFARPCGEDSLQKEGLVPGNPLLNYVSFPGFLLLPFTFLEEKGVELLLCLFRQVMIQELIQISDVDFHLRFSRMDVAVELVFKDWVGAELICSASGGRVL